MSTMKECIASLRSTKGATILMALLALLVAAMVSTVILAAAMSTVKQEKSDAEFQQCQLDLQSAGQYSLIDIIGDLEGKSSEKGGVTVTVTATKTIEDGVEVWTHGEPQLSSRSAVYGQALVDAVKAIHYSTPLVNGVYAVSLPDFVLEKTSGAAGGAVSDDFASRTVKVKLTAAPKTSDVNNTGTADDAAYEYILEFSSSNSVRDVAHQGTSQVLYLRLNEEGPDEKTSDDGKRKTITYGWSFDRFEALRSDDSAN